MQLHEAIEQAQREPDIPPSELQSCMWKIDRVGGWLGLIKMGLQLIEHYTRWGR